MGKPKVRTEVTFRHPAELILTSQEDGVLAIAGAQWFAALLRRVPDLVVDEDLCQEDWGVVFVARRRGKQFWIGLNSFYDGTWLAHFHHGSFAWLQRFSSKGKVELRELLVDVHTGLTCDASISEIVWSSEGHAGGAKSATFCTPSGD